MTRLCLLALALAWGASTSAQPLTARPGATIDDPYGSQRVEPFRYFATPVVALAYSDGFAGLAGGIVGRRVGDRGDVGLGLYVGDLAYSDLDPFVMVQPVAGVTVPLDDRVRGRVQVSGVALAADRETAFDPEGFGMRVYAAQAEATASYEVPVVGTLRIAPTAGPYGTVCTTVNVIDRADESCAEAGVLVGAQVIFEVGGVDAVVPLVAPIPLVGDADQADLDGAFNLARRAITGGLQIRF